MSEPKTIKADIIGSQRLYQKLAYFGNGQWIGGPLMSTIQGALGAGSSLDNRHFEIIAVDLKIPPDTNSVKVLSDDLHRAQNRIFHLEKNWSAALAEIEQLKQPSLSRAADTEHDVPAKNAVLLDSGLFDEQSKESAQ